VTDEGEIFIADISDPRLVASWRSSAAPAAHQRDLDGRWRNVDERNGMVEDLLGAPKATLSDNKKWTVNVWEREIEVADAQSGNRVLHLPHSAPVVAAFSADSRAIAIEQAGHVQMWSLDPDAYIGQLCERLALHERAAAPSGWLPAEFLAICRIDPGCIGRRLFGQLPTRACATAGVR
jgi:hypothetical protein